MGFEALLHNARGPRRDIGVVRSRASSGRSEPSGAIASQNAARHPEVLQNASQGHTRSCTGLTSRLALAGPWKARWEKEFHEVLIVVAGQRKPNRRGWF